MKREEILAKASEKKAIVGEAEKVKINKSCWIANIVAVVIAVMFMVVEGLLGHFSTIYVLGVVVVLGRAYFTSCNILWQKDLRAYW